MNIATIVRRSCPGYQDLAADAGLSYEYLRQLVAKSSPRNAGYEARHRIAKALRSRAAQMISDADALESGE